MSKNIRNKLFTLVLLAAVAALAPTRGASDNQAGEPSLAAPAIDFDARAVVQLIYAGRSDSALAVVDREERAHPHDPLVLLMKARAMRDQLADEDVNKDMIGEEQKPVHAALDRAIRLSEEAMDRGASDPIYRYYIGRAYLAKAQLHTLSREHWSAGGAARSAKNNLEKYLELRPNDPDAQGDLGAFLYFADTLPGIVKFLSKLLMFPGGDRDRGLVMLDYAASHGGIFETDHEITIAAINLLFEGNLRDGTDQMLGLIARYPYYTRLLEPVGVLAPLDPLRLNELLVAHDSAVDRHRNSGLVRYDDSLVKRMEIHSTFAGLFFGAPMEAMPRIDAVLADPPQRPDWAEPLIALNRAVFLTMDGRAAEARHDYESVLASDKSKHFHDIAKTLMKTTTDTPVMRPLQDLSWVDEIYNGRATNAQRGLRDYRSKYGSDRVFFFYAGELALFEQDFVKARRHYESCLEGYVDGIDQYYQFWACLRLAEIHGHQFRYEQAREYYDKARGYIRVTYLLDFMMTARVRYYTLLEQRRIKGPPRLLYYHTYESGATYDASPADARR